jgi:ACS family hexuronate transporter-like MFS transporter
MTADQPSVSRSFSTWWICGLLLCASTINYMDRQTLSTVSPRIKHEFNLSREMYGDLEFGFGVAFAIGAILFGAIADRTNVRWLYPVVLLLWSMMGFLTGYVETFAGLMTCRIFLGLFEAGHWPCALKTTYRLLPPEQRAFGNSVLQSGTAIGAILTPIIILNTMTEAAGSWRPVFQVIAAAGSVWAFVWIFSTRSADLAPVPSRAANSSETMDDDDTFFSAILSRRFMILVVIVIAINLCWQLFRAWMPLFLQEGRGYQEKSMLVFMFFFHISTDIGCLSSGYLTRRLHQSGYSTHQSRCIAFGVCAMLVALGGLIPWLPATSPGLTVVLMLVAAGALGLFPCYYSFSQELSTRHLGKVTGSLGAIAWVTSSPVHKYYGRLVDQTKSYDMGMALACGLPLAAFVILVLFWPAKRMEME